MGRKNTVGVAGSGARVQILSSWNDDESLCLSFESLKPVETAGHPGELTRGRFRGPLSPPCETPGCVSLLWLFTQALQFGSSYGEPNLNLFLVQVKSFGPISRTPCACMEHVIIPFFNFNPLLNVFVEKSVKDFSLLVLPLVDRTILRSNLDNFCIVSYR